MEKLNQKNLSRLLQVQHPSAVTIYVPTIMSASPPHISENQIRLKNLITKAIDELQAKGSYEMAIELTARLDRIHDDLNFWKDQTAGLLICAVPGQIDMFHLPVDTEEYVAVDDRFHLAPLVGLINDDRDFYVLELAEHNPELLKGDMYGLGPSGLELPANIKAVNEHHQTSHHGKLKESAHNHGYPGRFFRIIDDLIFGATDHKLPLILSGTETETNEYRHLSRYPRLLKTSIARNSLRMPPRQLYGRAAAIIQKELIGPDHESVIAEYARAEQANPSVISRDESTLLKAAEQGRIDKLLTVMRRQTTDTVQDGYQSTTRITFPEPRLDSLLNKMVPSVTSRKGLVLNLFPSEMPDRSAMVAKLRY